MKRAEKRRRIIAVAAVAAAVTVMLLLAGQAFVMLMEYISRPEQFRAWVDDHGVWGRIAFVGMVVLQVVVALLPGEPFEIAAGYAFGALEGTLLFLGASTLGSVLVFLLVRKFGMRLALLFFSKERLESIGFLKTNRRRTFLLLVVFSLPGTPKDLISYFAGLTDIRFGVWLAICSFGRIPSVISSTVGGDALGTRNYQISLIVFLVTIVVSVLGLLLYEQIRRRNRKGEDVMIEVVFPRTGEVEDGLLQYAVIVARYRQQWVLCRHKDRKTWEIPGGHRADGESIAETAMRELKEETGALDAGLQQISVYGVKNGEEISYGALFFAEITEMGPLSNEVEIGEIQLFDRLPEALTYPEIQGKLYNRVQGWRNLSTNADELWDVYDENRVLTGRLQRRGDGLETGDYHLVVYVWVRNSAGEFLLTKRSPNKGFPNLWETTGGSALAGDDSLTAALREVKEETGITLDPACGRLVLSEKGGNFFGDYWLFHHEFDLDAVVLQEGETCDKMAADEETIQTLRREGKFIPCRHLEEIFAAAREK